MLWTTILTMCLLSTIKTAHKQALSSGRVYKLKWRGYNPTPVQHLTGEDLQFVDFTAYNNQLTDQQWITFQAKERGLQRNAGHKETAREKSVWVRSYPSDTTAAALTAWIEAQLRFIRDVIQPQVRPRTSRVKKVRRDKLAYLWQHRRKRAIQIILNKSEYPETPPCPNNVNEVQSYYSDKCQGITSIDDAPLPPPWDDLLQSQESEFLPMSSPFTEDELRNVLDSLPHNKSSGSDGVMYETLKSTSLRQTLLPIFNTCLINKRVPKSWKGALIHRIPKKDNVPNDPSTWRDISLLPTIYKVFMKCVLSRILPWLVDANILSTKQKANIESKG
ncbi:uncharacterized protein LOC121679563 [Alosa sapidissima]|uniref:uncharacterized protein LOC121679563 n=1 Tax=Alosa sapidissima TaxID=34773 RepID=UPI001C0828C2|nr:uncharacterized protein LOC121679563 [Alosa sapidissima]